MRTPTDIKKKLIIYHIQSKLGDHDLYKFQTVTDLLIKNNRFVTNRSIALRELINYCYDTRSLMINKQILKELHSQFSILSNKILETNKNEHSEILKIKQLNKAGFQMFIPDLLRQETSFDYTSNSLDLQRSNHSESNLIFPLIYYSIIGSTYLKKILEDKERVIRLV